MNGRQLGKPQEHLYFHALNQKDVTKSFSCIEPLWPSASHKHVFTMFKRVAAPANAIAQFATIENNRANNWDDATFENTRLSSTL